MLKFQLLLGATAVTLAATASAQLGTNYCTPAVSNSTGQPAVVSATGSAVAGGNPLTLTASQLPTNQFGYFLTSQGQGLVMGPGASQGNLCLSGAIGRFNSQIGNSGGSGQISIAVDTLNMPLNPSVAVQAGETWNFQLWYRDVNPTATSNFTDGLEIAFTAGGGPMAEFTADVVLGTNPLVVNFTNLSTGATAYLWDFGDGGTTSDVNPTYTYLTRGIYTVTLTAFSGPNSDTEIKPNYIQVDQGFDDVWGYMIINNIEPSTGQPTASRCIDCHNTGGFGGLEMPDSMTAYANLVNVAAQCGGGTSGLRVAPGNPAASLFYTKLEGTQTCGQAMPFGSLFAGDLQVVENWILDGAQQ